MAAQGKTIYQIDELKPTLHELKAIGRNLNQLTMLAHQGRIYAPELTELLSLYRQILIALGGEINGGC